MKGAPSLRRRPTAAQATARPLESSVHHTPPAGLPASLPSQKKTTAKETCKAHRQRGTGQSEAVHILACACSSAHMRRQNWQPPPILTWQVMAWLNSALTCKGIEATLWEQSRRVRGRPMEQMACQGAGGRAREAPQPAPTGAAPSAPGRSPAYLCAVVGGAARVVAGGGVHQQLHGALQLVAALLPLSLRQPLVLLVNLAHVLLRARGVEVGAGQRAGQGSMGEFVDWNEN